MVRFSSPAAPDAAVTPDEGRQIRGYDMRSMPSARFRATLAAANKRLVCEVPFDPAERWTLPVVSVEPRRRGVEVAATVDDVSFDSAVVARAGRHWLLVDDATARRIEKGKGDEVMVVLAPRGAPSKHPMKTPKGGSVQALARLRAICAKLPESYEKIAWGTPTFRAGVKGKLYAMFSDDHHDDGRIAVLCPAPEGLQRELVASDPEVFFVPPYVGPAGWIGIRLDRKLPESALAAFIEQAYRMVAPPALAARLSPRPSTIS
ncbi:MAG TPA: MmcQ/YjbR family DNA-binding protein [Thermoanaerobaculia bacterium]|nr:MmcQ/YjbR family DNA-binding protein [Thermoanaerobaculia bacterium]